MSPEIWPPASFIKEEMAARGWNIDRLVEEIGVYHESRAVLNVIAGGRMKVDAAWALGRVFGPSMSYWRALDAAWWQGLRRKMRDE